jgi:hypothetical protein
MKNPEGFKRGRRSLRRYVPGMAASLWNQHLSEIRDERAI